MSNKSPIPYFDIGSVILKHIFIWMSVYYESGGDVSRIAGVLEDKAAKFREELGYNGNDGVNNHLKEGIHVNDEAIAAGVLPRLWKLIVSFCKNAEETQKNLKASTAKLIPSPLLILYNYLTVPDEPESSAFSLALCRALIFIQFRTYPYYSDFENKEFKLFSLEELQNSIETFRSRQKKNDNISAGPDNVVTAVCAHFFAMKEMFYLRFSDEGTMLLYLRSGDLSNIIRKEKNYYPEFRLNKDYKEIPRDSEISNSIWGIPLPIRGAETVFFGGLKKDYNSSIVMSVSGQAGIGKTSLALSLAAVLSPFQCKCYYLTVEEDPNDLRNRLRSLVPAYLKKLSIYNSTIDDWFHPRRVEIDNINAFSDFLEQLKMFVFPSEDIDNDSENLILPSICPLIVVIDSINGIVDAMGAIGKNIDFYNSIENFIKKCKQLKAFVILLSGENLPHFVRLDYLVDCVINLRHIDTDKIDEKPIRSFQLLKTRHQISRPGSHVMHLTGIDSFRLSPQIPSQLDKKENIRRPLPDKGRIVHTLNILDGYSILDGPNVEWLRNDRKFVDIFDKSQILIHGKGSSGKAGFALKILLSPPIEKNANIPVLEKGNFADLKYKRKVLIISFLFEKDYYEELERRIGKKIKYYSNLKNSKIECLYFFPGFLSPEDLISKITRELDCEKLKGEPYTGILLDGLHNIFLQFPNLQKRDMVWPMLYSVLVRYKLTIVTTFTTFTLEPSENDDSIDSKSTKKTSIRYLTHDEQILMKEGHTPFLHALVQASDYYILIEPRQDREDIRYEVKIKSAMDQEVKNNFCLWDRKELSLYKTQNKLPL